MGVIMKLRRAGVAIIIGIALLAFIVGGVIQSGSIFNRNRDVIAEINGTKIHYLDFERKVEEARKYYEILYNQTSLDANTMQQIRDQIWAITELEAMLGPTLDELGITVSKEELWDMVQGQNIHPEIRKIFVNQNGFFDKNLLISFLQSLNDPNNPQAEDAKYFWDYLVKDIKRQRRFDKYLNLVNKSLFANKLEAEDNYIGRRKMANLDIVGKTYIDIPDSLIKVTQADLKDYYEKHKELYYQNQETRSLAYVVFKVVASSEDSLKAYEIVKNLKKAFAQAEDVIEFIRTNAENGQYPRFYSRNDLKLEGLPDTLFNLPIDSVYGPFLNGNAYMIARALDRAERPDTVSAEHILISPQNPKVKTWERAKEIADSLKQVIENGGDFKSLALQYSDDPSVRQNFGLYENFTEGKMVKEFNDFCFENKTGDIGVVKTMYGYHVVRITKQSKPVEKVELGFVDSEIEISQKTFNDYYSQAAMFRTSCKDTSDFFKVAGKNHLRIYNAPDLTQGTNQISGLGEDSRKIIRWAFKSEEGALSEVEDLNDKYVVAALIEVNPQGYRPFEKVKNRIEKTVLIEKKVDYLYDQYKNTKGNNLDEIAKAWNVNQVSVPTVTFSAYQIKDFGNEPAILAYIPTIEEGKLYGLIKGKNGIYYMQATKVFNPQEMTDDDYNKIMQELSTSYRKNAQYMIFGAIRNRVEYIDHRAQFF